MLNNHHISTTLLQPEYMRMVLYDLELYLVTGYQEGLPNPCSVIKSDRSFVKADNSGIPQRASIKGQGVFEMSLKYSQGLGRQRRHL